MVNYQKINEYSAWLFIVLSVLCIAGISYTYYQQKNLSLISTENTINIKTTNNSEQKIAENENKKSTQGMALNTSTNYPWHINIRATTFWVGEIFNERVSDGSQVCSTYDKDWAYDYSNINTYKIPETSIACPGSIAGGCDGVWEHNNGIKTCSTELRSKDNDYFPTKIIPKENPFYVALPYDDVNDEKGFDERCKNIPWAFDHEYSGHCTDPHFSYLKNRWVEIIGPHNATCFGQIEDAGPSHDELYHDASYVFGNTNAQPVQQYFNNAGLDMSPALTSCVGFADIDGEGERVKWRFVQNKDVLDGPWKHIITTRQVQL